MRRKTGSGDPCESCGSKFDPRPPLSRRVGPDGRAPTRKEALSLFRPHGLCVDCQLEKRARDTSDLMARRRAADAARGVVVGTFSMKLKHHEKV